MYIFSTTPIRIVYHGIIASRLLSFLSGFIEKSFNLKEWCVEESDTHTHVHSHIYTKKGEEMRITS